MTTPLWRQIQRNNFIRIEPLLDFLQLSPSLRSRILLRPKFILNLPVRLAAKIEKNTLEDPILRQFIPLIEEEMKTPGFHLDPVEDQTFQKAPKLLHKYEGRALLISTSACAMHCRYCFRQNFPYETRDKSFEKEIAYIENNPISEIIFSGGDPLSLSDETLSHLFRSLDSISHLKRIRFHTRFPIGIPERIDSSFLTVLQSSSKQIFFVIHANHPKELDADVLGSLKNIQRLSIPVLNQSVLLKGVNDDEKTLLSLSETLLNGGILPYYLHLLDRVEGAEHFNLFEERGVELIQYVQSHLSGFGVPRLVREEPGKASKTFV